MKYKAVCMVTIEIHQVDDKNECTGKIISSSELQEHNIKRNQLKVIEGFDKEDCLTKVKEWLK